MGLILIQDASAHLDQQVTLRGWVYNLRSSGKIHFLQFRDGTGILQCIADTHSLDDTSQKALSRLSLETSVVVSGIMRAEPRSPGGVELHVESLAVVNESVDYPIGKKAHGVDFLLDQRHLWIRSLKQRAILVIRDETIWALRSFMRLKGFRLTDTPILTPTACEGTTTLFETDYFGEPAFLSQSGQLYLEALAMSLGKVYDLGPTFRAEKSKTRRHLNEFWMLDAEMAFATHDDNVKLQEEMIWHVASHVKETCAKELATLERSVAIFDLLKPPYPRLTYDEAITKLHELGSDIVAGEDMGNDDETMLMTAYKTPLFVTHYPVSVKAFYMQPDPKNTDRVLCDDLLLPEGYGEVIGGSERIADVTLLKQRLQEHGLSEKDFGWYLDLRKYGSVPHAGFGIGIERLVTFFCGLPHVREAIPFPRTLNRLRP